MRRKALDKLLTMVGGLLTIVLIGLLVENVIFRVVGIRTVQRWGMHG